MRSLVQCWEKDVWAPATYRVEECAPEWTSEARERKGRSSTRRPLQSRRPGTLDQTSTKAPAFQLFGPPHPSHHFFARAMA